MDFPTAVREGVKHRPQQNFGTFYHEDTASCVLGSAFEGLLGGLLPRSNPSTGKSLQKKLLEAFPILSKADVHCPGCHDGGSYLFAGLRYFVSDLCVHLNDDHHWTREAIADWAESL